MDGLNPVTPYAAQSFFRAVFVFCHDFFRIEYLIAGPALKLDTPSRCGQTYISLVAERADQHRPFSG
jgi:hypothetical protein